VECPRTVIGAATGMERIGNRAGRRSKGFAKSMPMAPLLTSSSPYSAGRLNAAFHGCHHVTLSKKAYSQNEPI
jgi:hypothetical protein